MKKRTVISVETDRLIVVGKRKSNPLIWCAGCASRVRMITVDEAAAITRTSSRTIFQWVEADRLHFTETPDGRLFICPNSLS
jgi:excisionase family DNA binding protein